MIEQKYGKHRDEIKMSTHKSNTVSCQLIDGRQSRHRKKISKAHRDVNPLKKSVSTIRLVIAIESLISKIIIERL